jgi:hypothetical protein
MIIGINRVRDTQRLVAFRPNIGAKVLPGFEGAATYIHANEISARLVVSVERVRHVRIGVETLPKSKRFSEVRRLLSLLVGRRHTWNTVACFNHKCNGPADTSDG